MGQSSSLTSSSRSSSHSHSTNNLPPLLFHNVHGENIRISRDGTVARRVESFCKGIAFSSRPVKVNEKVCIKFLDISNNWSGVIRFGFTSNDPTGLRYGLPKYACPDLTNKPGYWAKALPERFCSQSTVLFYYVTSTGDVHFGINGEEKGIFFGGVETRGPVWALLDVYGNSTAVEFVDVRHQLNNSRSNVTPTPTNTCEIPAPAVHPRTPDPVDRITYPMQQLQIQQATNQAQNPDLSLPLLRYQPHNVPYQALPLHRTRGRNVRFCGGNRSVAMRTDTEFCQGYVFTARPLQIAERLVVQILATDQMFQGCLGLGLTSCDPSTLTSSDLPDDSNFLLDRPEYWVLSRDFARNLNKGDEVSFCISATGEVQISRNGGAPLVVMHVDQTLRLWAFFDIYGSTKRIRLLSAQSPNLVGSPIRNSSSQSIVDRRLLATSESVNTLNLQNEMSRQGSNNSRQSLVVRDADIVAVQARPTQPQNGRLCFPQADIQVQPSANGGAVLSVILPPASQINHNGYGTHTPSPLSPVSTVMAPVPTTSSIVPSGTMMSSCSAQYIEPISVSDSSTYSTPLSWAEQNNAGATHTLTAGAECTICYENSIDAVLYMCGHMCMCYDCALQQWRGKGGGHCPLCRAIIRDVIRTYKS